MESKTSKQNKTNHSTASKEVRFFDTKNVALNSGKIKGEKEMNKELLMPYNLQFFAEGEGGTESEVAEPTDVNEVESSTTEGETSTEESTEVEESNVQSDEENAKYAAARRRAEAEFAERQRREDEKFERAFKGFENPITHAPIKNAQDYLDALDAQNKLEARSQLESKGIDPNLFEEMVNRQVENNPFVQQAQVVLEEARQRELNETVNTGLKEIQKLNPSIKTIQDVLNQPNVEQFIEYTKTMSMVDAYKLANFDSLMAGKVAGAKQAALNNMNGTAHLNQTDGLANADNGEVEIPQDELGAWKRAFPHANAAELRKKYNNAINS